MTDRQGDTLHPGELDELPAVGREDADWLRRVRDCYSASTDFLETGVRGEWTASLARFAGKHPPGSKYHSAAYRGRSKTFRPKTRSYARRAEANAAKALFSNTDLVDVRGHNRGDPAQAASARLYKALLQYRLEHSVPWFLTAIGARQDCFNFGICVSLQDWEFEVEEERQIKPVIGPDGGPIYDEDGNELGEEVVYQRVVEDRPRIDLIPPENFRFDPNADWRNPVEDSPYLIVMLQRTAGEVLERMERPNPRTGEPDWRDYTLPEILAASQDKTVNEVVRQARMGGNRRDPIDLIKGDENSVVWVYLNIMRRDGVDYGFYTLGSMLMLTDPVPVNELLSLGREAITVGFSMVETHKAYPMGGNALAAPMQAEINDITNQRMDNVRLALNKRYLIRRNRNIDQQALMRSVPGGGVMADDPDSDVRVLDYQDVTASSYQEQNLLAQELDELAGMFSGSSVQANRALNETVGGMNLLQSDASDVAEYELRTFVETWVEPVLRKLQRLEAMYETDQVVLQLAAENAELFQQYGTDLAVDQLLDHELVVSVNVGMGNTNPMQRLQRFTRVLMAAAQIPEVSQAMNGEEVGKEMFAMGGYSEGSRFFLTPDQVAERQAQQAQAQQQPEQPAPDHSMEVAQLRAQTDQAVAQLEAETRRMIAQMQEETKRIKLAAEGDIKLKDIEAKFSLGTAKIQTDRDTKALTEGNRSREMSLKARMGSGI